MRAVIQRVASASVTVDNEVISSISRGLMVLVGIGRDDTAADILFLAKKMYSLASDLPLFCKQDHDPWEAVARSNAYLPSLSLRVFADPVDETKMWKSNVTDINGDVLCVSQFTLMANTSKGNKPDFHQAMSAESSRVLYTSFLDKMRELYQPDKIKDGKFGAMMNVTLTNEGPVTFTIESRKD